MPLHFFCEDIRFALSSPQETTTWMTMAVNMENATLSKVTCIFCSDAFLLRLNKKYLNHNTYTDILTFDYTSSKERQGLEGDMFISIDRVKENAIRFKEPFEYELHRVLVHGLLHLLGFKDKTHPQQVIMRKKEKKYLDLLAQHVSTVSG